MSGPSVVARLTLAVLPCALAPAQHDGFVVHTVALAPDAGAAAFGRVTDMGSGGRLLLRAAGADEPREVCTCAIVRAIAFAPDGGSLCYSDDGGRILQVDRDGAAVRTYELGRLPGFVRGVALSADGRRLCAVDDEHRVQCFATGDGEKLWSAKTEALPLCVTFLPDGRLALGDNRGTVTLWSADGKPEPAVPVLDANVFQLAVDRAGTQLAAVGWKGGLAIVDLRTREVTRRATDKERTYAVVFDPAGDRLAIAQGGKVLIRSVAVGEEGAGEEGAGDEPAGERDLQPPRTIGALRWLMVDGEPRLYAADYRGGIHVLEP